MRSKEAWIQLFIVDVIQPQHMSNSTTDESENQASRGISLKAPRSLSQQCVCQNCVFCMFYRVYLALCLCVSALRSPLSAKCRLHSEHSSVILLLLLWKAQTWHRLTASAVYPTRRTRANVQRTWHGILGGNMADGWAPSSAGSQHLRQDSKPNRVSDSRAHI